MILGIGLDIVELDRIQQALERSNNKFSSRILTESELLEWDGFSSESRRIEFLAGRFAVKEAVSKAFGTGIGEISFQDITIYKDNSGKPEVRLTGNAEKIAKKMGVDHTWVSITHSRTYAIAQVILEKKQA